MKDIIEKKTKKISIAFLLDRKVSNSILTVSEEEL